MADRIESTAININNVLPTKLDPASLRFESNMRAMADLVAAVRNEEEQIREGGGAKAIENQHAKGRMTARERIEKLADPGIVQRFLSGPRRLAHPRHRDNLATV